MAQENSTEVKPSLLPLSSSSPPTKRPPGHNCHIGGHGYNFAPIMCPKWRTCPVLKTCPPNGIFKRCFIGKGIIFLQAK